ncbi:FAD-dependent oxidoreductase [Lentzea sp. NBC_00516]|uniref:NAD(P)/FAD-dependent oxidoreductase n=1 Tax=Lentzea sp. NBC_00516 TaxID=2903582 RepID=UPI002E824446|nr:FAD-dependent oxidoreductase [Lentzea sp. NBC_00516]WUD29287.1 FAD-dependent oxidoreductase [Lentzea sp. NBC_00516]
MTREHIAVIGAGVAGLTAAHLLSRCHDVVVYEAGTKPGGHADTRTIRTPDSAFVQVDTGFIVHNGPNYPCLTRLFEELGVRTRTSDMSMSVSCRECGLEYAGGKRGAGLVTPGAMRAGRRYLGMLAELPRFNRTARRLLAGRDTGASLGEFLVRGRFSRYFVDHYALPLVSAVWSAGEEVSTRYPARYLFAFLDHHGLLGIRPAKGWRTVVGGSQTYVDRIAAGLSVLKTATPARAVRRHDTHVEILDPTGTSSMFDRVVLATHADQALALLADPTAAERRALGGFRYSRNEMWLHTDSAVLPRSEGARASWNHTKRTCRGAGPALVSYDLNRLMGLSEPLRYVVTLNGESDVDSSAVVAEAVYEHPVYTSASVAAQRELPSLNTGRTAYAGAYHGWGFHEDGCLSGVRAARAFGVKW